MIKTNTDIKHHIKNSWLLLVLIFLFFYLLYHIISGDRGLIKMVYLRKQLQESHQVLSKKDTEKSQLEDKVKRLSSKSLDLDLLDERARVVLNFAQYDDFIILDK